MRIAHIQNGSVVNVIEAESTPPGSETDSYVASDTAGVGWSLVDGELQAPAVDCLARAETHIESFFSTARLLQCKVWLDVLSRETTPKLNSLFAWTATVTGMAIQSQTAFPLPPVTFVEVAQECIPQLT